MNILTDILPKTIKIGNKNIEINTDFRAGIEFETMIQRGEKNPWRLIKPFLYNNILPDIEEALSAIMLFYCCGKLPEETDEVKANKKQAYSFEFDSRVIFADFWRCYNIDLSNEGLHWWTFRTLLDGLPEESEFKQRAYYRTCDLKKVSKAERKRIKEIRARIEIKTAENGKMTLEERNEFMRNYVKRRNKQSGGEE